MDAMEGNRDEANRCIEMALGAIKFSNYEKAKKLLDKAQSLYPSKRGEQLLKAININLTSEQKSRDSEMRHRKGNQESGSDEKLKKEEEKYTTEQLHLVQKIKKCKDFYEVLGITKDSTDSEIKKAYKKLALQLHPDKNHAPGASEAFKVVGNAVATLTDPQKRKEYELFGGTKNISNGNHNNHNHYHGTTFEYASFNGFESDVSAEELFNMFFGGFPSQGTQRQRFNGQNYHNYREHQHYDSSPQPSLAFGLIMVLIIISMLSSFFTSDPLYNLSQTTKYTVKRHTTHLGVPYYVKDNFAEEYQGSLVRLENSVEEEYIYIMKQNCYRERNYRDSMIARARSFGSRSQLAQAQGIKTPSCDNLSKIGLTRYSLF